MPQPVTKEQIEFFRALAARRQDGARLRHTQGVARAALALAARHGAGANEAEAAALLHDMMKGTPFAEQIAMARAQGLLRGPEDEEMPQTLHGRLTAAWLRREYAELPPEIAAAVENHTLGRPGMGPLEMIIYSADLTEEGRDFFGLDILRRKLYDDLAEGTLACMDSTIKRLQAEGKPIHSLTLAARADLRRRLGIDADERNI
ncbi:MAG: bis(5'-nucleosyl)-tetraphosphatase (symmetrical) YqeK [Gracilibacteraceae bacterium]|jgi:predicted HD superfamily hydrolase involved in NAD metabolism|nr:bis(5'-nucleosyl)-tetraphosphatase (symmetrical) YqeK [Gracilibacteraceae bacterium]